jgi:hypothetical protein
MAPNLSDPKEVVNEWNFALEKTNENDKESCGLRAPMCVSRLTKRFGVKRVESN